MLKVGTAKNKGFDNGKINVSIHLSTMVQRKIFQYFDHIGCRQRNNLDKVVVQDKIVSLCYVT